MRIFARSAVLFLIVVCPSLASSSIPDGTYSGQNPTDNFGEPGQKWFQQNQLIIKSDQVWLSQDPFYIDKNGRRYSSASDGGFFYWSGRIVNRDGKLVIRMKLINADYVLFNESPGSFREYRLDPKVAKRFKGYENWPKQKQFENGILVRRSEITPKPSENPVTYKNGVLRFQGVSYRKVSSQSEKPKIIAVMEKMTDS